MSALPTSVEPAVTADEARRAEPIVREPDALAMAEAKHAHEQATLRAEQGKLGTWLGSRAEKPGNVALIVILICFLFIGLGMFAFGKEFEQFMKFSTALFAIISGALGYLFGSSHK